MGKRPPLTEKSRTRVGGAARCAALQVVGALGVELTMKDHAIFQRILKLLLAE